MHPHVEHAIRLLQTTTGEAASLAVRGVAEGSTTLLRQVLTAVDEGESLPWETVLLLSKRETVQAMMGRKWPYGKAFQDDAHFSVTKVDLLTAGWVPTTRNMDRTTWEALRDQIRRMWLTGQVDDSDRLLRLLPFCIFFWDTKFAVELLAHSSKTVTEYFHSMNGGNMSMAIFLDRKMEARVERNRARLQRRWLKAQVPAATYRQLTKWPQTLVRDLYGPIMNAGYAGYRAHLLTKATA